LGLFPTAKKAPKIYAFGFGFWRKKAKTPSKMFLWHMNQNPKAKSKPSQAFHIFKLIKKKKNAYILVLLRKPFNIDR
jgi:hypothetical protein